MKKKFLKVGIAIVLLITLTMTNFIFVGSSIISYALDEIQTNHQNIQFDVYFKDQQNNRTENLKIMPDVEEVKLFLKVNVHKEGYFNGKIEIPSTNFRIEGTDSKYVQKIEGNTIILNQVNAGTSAEIELKVKPIKDEKIDIGLFNNSTTVNLNGIYKDSTEKDIKIKASRNAKLELIENNTADTVENDIEVITNKIVKIAGEDKRIIQLSVNMGLKDNNYPVKEIYSKITVPVIDGKQPEVKKVINLSCMAEYNYNYNGKEIETVFSNVPSDNNLILWNKEEKQNAIYTYIYDKDVNLKGLEITSEETIVLHNDREIEKNTKKIVLDDKEKDNIIQISSKNTEDSIYKGKLYSGIDRQIVNTTVLSVNLPKVAEYIDVKEERSNYINGQASIEANTYYNKTVVNKENFDNIFGATGIINIYNENREILFTINNATKADENGNIVIDYTGKEPKAIEIKTTSPVEEGKIDFEHTKTISKTNRDAILGVTELETNIKAKYNDYAENEIGKLVTYSKGISTNVKNKMQLKETKTQATAEINKDTLSTIIDNEIQLKAVLNSNIEEYDLYKNPTLKMQLPEEVESIDISSVDLVYETEMKIKNYRVEGNTIVVELEGEQTSYKTQAINGANIIINAKVALNKIVASKEQVIKMIYTNQNAKETQSIVQIPIKIVAPKDITAVHSINELGVETIGQDEIKKVTVKIGTQKQELEDRIEIINNNAETIEDVKVLGMLPTNNKENTLGIKITKSIEFAGAQIYYTENANASNDIKDTKNGWSQTITDKSIKYLIIVDKIDGQQSLVGTYKFEIPENLEYNQSAKTGYTVTYKHSLSNSESTSKSTTIILETGIGPKADVKLLANVGGQTVNSDAQTIRNGEIISFNVQVSNTGSEDIDNVNVSAKIPEGTTLVVPQDNYEYTGASYYKEIKTDSFEEKVGNLKTGEVKTVTFEVRVNSEINSGKEIVSDAKIQYGDVIKTSNKVKVTTQTGNIRVSVKRVTDRDIDLYEAGTVQYYAIIENISNNKQENVKVKTNISDNLKAQRLTLITGMESTEISDDEIYKPGKTKSTEKLKSANKSNQNVISEDIEYKEEINIGKLEPKEVKVLSYDMLINKTENSKIDFSVNVNNGKEEYKSNNWSDAVESYKVSMSMKDNTTSKYLKSGDIVEYTIIVKNESTTDIEGLNVKDSIPPQMTIRKVVVDGHDLGGANGNNLEITTNIAKDGQSIIKIEAIINHSEGRDNPETIVNKAEAVMLGKSIATTSEVSHIIEANKTDDSTTTDDNSNNDVSDNNVAQGNKIISGMAWYDENKDGKKDDNERAFKDIGVTLLNIETKELVKDKNGKNIEAKTNDNGIYVLNNIGNGKYIVIFDYDSTKYSVTKYMTTGVVESKNSNAMMNELTIGSEKEKVTSTDIIEVNNQSVSDINIGLIELKAFDFKLEKFVSKILVQNSSGTTVKEYTDSVLAKYEIDGKLVNGTTIIVEYKIRVTNVGELEGYVKKVVDYMPSDLKFSSELNSDWYQSGENLYNTSLSNEKIATGETKILTLTLTKSMTENNVGLFNNRAEILESYNELGIEEIDRAQNNKGAADTIINIKTGGTLWFASIVIISIVGLGIIAVIVIKQKNKRENI